MPSSRYGSCNPAIMGIAHDVTVAAGHVLSAFHAGEKQIAAHKLVGNSAPSISVTSVAFEADGTLPVSCTVDGVGAPPPLEFQGVPEAATSVVVICEDPDAPFPEPYVHWIVYGIPRAVGVVDAPTQSTYRLGLNSKLEVGFTPAAPPPGHGVHHYHFQVFAVDHELGLTAGAGRSDVLEAMQGHVLAWGQIVGTYQRE